MRWNKPEKQSGMLNLYESKGGLARLGFSAGVTAWKTDNKEFE